MELGEIDAQMSNRPWARGGHWVLGNTEINWAETCSCIMCIVAEAPNLEHECNKISQTSFPT